MEQLESVIDLNFTALIRCTRLAFKSMELRGVHGYIVNINSVYGRTTAPFLKDQYIPLGVYPCSKFAVTAASDLMRVELNEMKNFKVRVTSICPGVVQTALFKNANTSEEMEKRFYKNPVLNANHIADTVIYVLSTPYEVTINELTIRATGSEL